MSLTKKKCHIVTTVEDEGWYKATTKKLINIDFRSEKHIKQSRSIKISKRGKCECECERRRWKCFLFYILMVWIFIFFLSFVASLVFFFFIQFYREYEEYLHTERERVWESLSTPSSFIQIKIRFFTRP